MKNRHSPEEPQGKPAFDFAALEREITVSSDIYTLKRIAFGLMYQMKFSTLAIPCDGCRLPKGFVIGGPNKIHRAAGDAALTGGAR